MSDQLPESIASALVDEWERIEGESMRDGHRHTLERLIAELLRLDTRTEDRLDLLLLALQIRAQLGERREAMDQLRAAADAVLFWVHPHEADMDARRALAALALAALDAV